jgi:hypothetical protein
MAEPVGARSVYKIGFPLQAIQKAIDTGVLPKLDQTKAPTGYDLSYNFQNFGAVSSPAAADARLRELGGLPITLVREPEPEAPWWAQALGVAGALFGFTTVGGALSGTLEGVSKQEFVDPIVGKQVGVGTLTSTQGGSMAFQDGDSGFFGDVFGGLNNILQANGQNLLNLGFNAANSFVQSQFAPQPVSMPSAQPAMAAVPAIVGAGRAVATVGRGFFNRFPNLATSLQSLRNRGANVSRSSLYSAMRRFGPEMLVSGGILTAAAVSELAVAGPGRRRMNPGNVKALRRAHRRMKSFHHLCTDNDMLYKRSRRK